MLITSASISSCSAKTVSTTRSQSASLVTSIGRRAIEVAAEVFAAEGLASPAHEIGLRAGWGPQRPAETIALNGSDGRGHSSNAAMSARRGDGGQVGAQLDRHDLAARLGEGDRQPARAQPISSMRLLGQMWASPTRSSSRSGR